MNNFNVQYIQYTHGSVITFWIILFFTSHDLTNVIDKNYDLLKITHFISLNNNI